jgi:hypothetical protein
LLATLAANLGAIFNSVVILPHFPHRSKGNILNIYTVELTSVQKGSVAFVGGSLQMAVSLRSGRIFQNRFVGDLSFHFGFTCERVIVLRILLNFLTSKWQ